MGKDCLLLWLTDIGDVTHHASCPMCRMELIKEKRQHIGTDEGLRQLLRDVNYLLTGPGPLTLTQEGRDQWEGVKSYVNAHLANRAEAERQRLQRFMMLMRSQLRTNPNFTTTMMGDENVEELQVESDKALDDLERLGIMAEYLNAADAAQGNELGDDIAVHLQATIPPRIFRLMEEVYEDRFGGYSLENVESFADDDDSDKESGSYSEPDDDEIDVDNFVRNDNSIWCEGCQGWHRRPQQPEIHPAPRIPLNSWLTVAYLEDNVMVRPTSAPLQVGASGQENYSSWYTSCSRAHPEGTDYRDGIHGDDVA